VLRLASTTLPSTSSSGGNAVCRSVQQAHDAARRPKNAGETRHSLERTLDWLADGVALVRADGTAAFANESFQAIGRRDDGLRVKNGAIEFADAAARAKFNAAVTSAARRRIGKPDNTIAADFTAVRSAGGRPYLVSVRPLVEGVGPRRHPPQAVAIVLVRDLHARGAAATAALREIFKLTEAEAALAQGLQSGITLGDYARRRALTLNTVYTHLRRLREKTGSTRMAELIYKLNDLQLPLRVGET
jgi:DNA-binding CsgD family transcriptional regulator